MTSPKTSDGAPIPVGPAAFATSGTKAWAVASLILGIVSLAGGCVFGILPILAIVFGCIAMRTSRQATSRGLAIAGIIMGTLGLLIFGVLIVRMMF